MGHIGRQTQDKAEIEVLGDVAGGGFVDADDLAGLTGSVCTACHSLQGVRAATSSLATCNNPTFKSRLIDGRLSQKVWECVAKKQNTGSTCGWSATRSPGRNFSPAASFGQGGRRFPLLFLLAPARFAQSA